MIVGTGWAAHALAKVADHESVDIVVVSPRNYFIFTPMLPSAAVGTVEFRSILDPIRSANPKVKYVEATVDRIDPVAKVAYCTSSSSAEGRGRVSFALPYDVGVVAVGEQAGTFG